MNNEPVAWMQVHYKDNRPTKFSKVQTWEDDIPLYTHPAKTLTDEEIRNEIYKHTYPVPPELVFDIVKGLLRKASEK